MISKAMRINFAVRDVNEAVLSDRVACLPENSVPGVTVGKPMQFDDPDFAQTGFYREGERRRHLPYIRMVK